MRKHAKKSSFICLCYILRAIGAGRCRERRYADHIFIQIYFRMHHFVVKFSKFSSPQAAREHWPPNQNPADVPEPKSVLFNLTSSCLYPASNCAVSVCVCQLSASTSSLPELHRACSTTRPEVTSSTSRSARWHCCDWAGRGGTPDLTDCSIWPEWW